MNSFWSGVMPAITTPFDPDGSISKSAVVARIERAIGAGVTAIIPAGSLGEGAALSESEKHELFQICVETTAERVPVIPAIASASTRDAIALAHQAEQLGCRGLMVLPPYVHSGDTREVLAHVSAIFEATPLPCMLYNNPIAYGADLTASELKELAMRHSNLGAVKESSGDVRRITAICECMGDRLAPFVGLDNLAVEGARAGAVGWVAGLVNAFPVESVQLFELARSGDPRADELYHWFLPLLRLDVVPDFVQRIKAVEAELDLGPASVRPPRLPLESADLQQVREIVRVALENRPS